VHESDVVVLFAGGGTGGHLYPAIALADALVALRPEVRPVFVGAERGVEARILPQRGAEHILLPIRGVHRGRGWGANLGVAPALVRSLALLVGEFQRLRPELVVVTGGYAAAPAGLMAVLRRVPLAVQEQNAMPGVTTRLLAPFARQVHLAYPEAAPRLPRRGRRRVEFVGNPIRPPELRDARADRRSFGLDPDRPVVLVTGGSQGSAALNEAVAAMVRGRADTAPAWQLLWVTGPTHLDAVREQLGALTEMPWLRTVGYVDDMPVGLSAAHLAVSRAGAMTTSEFLAWGLPSLLVPLPTSAEGHQARNAEALAAAGASVHLPQSELSGEALGGRLDDLVGDAGRLEAMSRAARARSRPHSAHEIARRLDQLLKRPDRGQP
jgi:UDP-N-acetylglucosamine--N-acetylmuramyl-(pentapeptide) pyrophosphoryl-undecaprenol N-acetylglucosamine transferase